MYSVSSPPLLSSAQNEADPDSMVDYICRKRNLGNAESWALIVRLSDGDIVVPLDRTVESLGDQHEVVLVARSQVGTVGLRQRRNPQNIDPSGELSLLFPISCSELLNEVASWCSFDLSATSRRTNYSEISIRFAIDVDLSALSSSTKVTHVPRRETSSYDCHRWG